MTTVHADAAAFGAQALALTQDAGAVLNSAFGLAGNYGRYAAATPDPALVSLDAALAQANAARAAVSATVAALQAAAATGAGEPDAVQAVLDAVAAATRAPEDQLRAFGVLAGVAGSSPLGLLCRQASAIALAVAASAYEPTSYDDAQSVLQQVADVLDAAVTEAGDADDDGSFGAFIALRAMVVADLTVRGASLAPLVTRLFGANLPALVVAATLYGDASRADELVRRVDPVHPLFMPATMTVLGS